MNDEPDGGYLAPSDIADLAGVSRAAVSNWRRRELDFPAPVSGTKANPLFDRADVERWLAARRPQTPRADRVSAGLALWSVMNGYRKEIPMHAMQTLALSVLCARKLAASTDHAEELLRGASQGRFLQAADVLADAPGADPRWRELVAVGSDSLTGQGFDRLAGELYGVIDSTAVGELAKAADYVVDRVTATEGRTAGEHGGVGSLMSQLLADAASTDASLPPTTAYDPACGIGEALIEFWRRSPDPDRLHLYGAEINENYARVCRQRCFLYGATATVACGDVLMADPLPGLSADVVMAEPPFGLAMPTGFSLADSRWALAGLPPKGDADTAWIQHVIAHLAPGGRGLVVTALSTTSAPASAAVRRSLVQRGCVDAVVALPRKLLSHTPIQTALWILRPPDRPEGSEEILFVDATSLNPSKPLDLQILSTSDWADDNPDTLSAATGVEDVLADEQARLDPRYWTVATVDPGEVHDRYRTAISLLDHVLEDIAETELTLAAVPPASRTITIRELERQGAVTLIKGGTANPSPRADRVDHGALGENWQRRLRERRWAAEDSNPWVATQRMVRDGLLERPPAHDRYVGEDETESADALERAGDKRSEPGDILAASGRAVVDDHGGWIPGMGVTRIVVDPHHLAPHYVADCLNSSWNQRAGTTSSMTIPLRDLEIPLIPLQDQLQLANDARQARELALNGRELAQAAEEIVAVRLDAIRHNVDLGGVSISGQRWPATPPAKGEGPFGPT